MGGTVEVRAVVERQATAAFPALTEASCSPTSSSPTMWSGPALLHRRLGGETVLGGEPTIVALANSWIIINLGGGPTEDKPAVSLETPRNPDRVSSFLNIRVPDIQSIYEQWHARGAEFLTHRSTAGARSAPTSATPMAT